MLPGCLPANRQAEEVGVSDLLMSRKEIGKWGYGFCESKIILPEPVPWMVRVCFQHFSDLAG